MNELNLNKSISVIIPVKNEEEKLEKCLEAVFSQTIKPHEVIVVDGHSKDRTVEKAKRFPVRILYENYGTRGGARQLGVENAIGEYVAFTDADCIPEPNWLENLVKEFCDDIVGVGGGTKNIGEKIFEKSIALALDTFIGSANSVQDRVFKVKKNVKSISGCNSMYRKDSLVKVGGFNVKLNINEDTEVNRRLLKIGTLLYTPDSIILHNQTRNLRGFIKRMFLFGYGRGNNRLWDLQVIPPFASIIVFLLYFISVNLFVNIILLYLMIILFYDFMILIRVKKLQYFVIIPFIFILEHLSYTIGFWNGFLKSFFDKTN